QVPAHVCELGGVGGVADHVAGAAALDAVEKTGMVHGGGGGHQDGAELDRREHGVPQLDLVAEHGKDRVAAPHTSTAQPDGETVGTACHLLKGVGGAAAVRFHDDQGRTVVAAGHGIEPVVRPVEAGSHLGPG